MKKVLSAFLALLLSMSLCACKSPFGDINKTVSEIADKTGITYENGIFVKSKKGDEISKIKPAEISSLAPMSDCYYAISEEEQVIYRYILSIAREMSEGFVYCGAVTDNFESDVAIAYRAVLADNPDIFWMPPTYIISTSDSKLCIAFSLDDDDIKNEYLMNKETRDLYAAKLNEKANLIINSAATKPNDYEKEKYIHDYLAGNAVYNLDGGDMIFSSYGAIVDGVCVCEGFSRAFQLLLKKLGINSCLVYGIYQDEGHMWNRVKLGDAWYNVDITWDQDEKIGTLHYYFNIPDSELKVDHTISPLRTSKNKVDNGQSFNVILHNCDNSDYWFFNYENRFLTDNLYNTSNIILKDFRENKGFSELLGGEYNTEEILNRVAGNVYGEATLKSYSVIRREVLVFFENTY